MIRNDVNWKEFFLEDVVTIGNGVRLTKSDMNKGDTPFIGASEMNNGITAYCSNRNCSYDNNVLGVNYNGSVGFSFYHPYFALFSDDVKRVKWKDASKNNKYTLLFLAVTVKAQKDKYAYGYKFNSQRMKRQKILLPINDKNEPDYAYMEAYMRAKEQEILKPTIDRLCKRLKTSKIIGGGCWPALNGKYSSLLKFLPKLKEERDLRKPTILTERGLMCHQQHIIMELTASSEMMAA